MALSAGNVATSADIKALKQRMKDEMYRRRNGTSPYGTNAVPSVYWENNFSASADAGQQIRTSHYRETVGYVSDLFTTDLTYWPTSISSGTKLGQLQTIWDYIGTLKNTSMQATGTHCRAGCRGLCYNSCQAGCEEGCTTVHGNCSNYLGGSYPCGR